MSEELAAGSISLEESELVGAVTDTPPETPEATDDPEPEGTVEIPTGKVVPLQALQAERGKAKEAKAEAETLKQQMALYKAAAEEYEALKPKLAEAMPIIEAVRKRPDLVRLANEPPPAPVEPAGPLSAQEAVEYAKDMDLYKADGTPDVERAQRLAARQEAIAAKQAQRFVAPFEAQTAQRQAQEMFQQVATMKDTQGRTVDPNALKQIWGSVPAELASRPEVASVLYYAAKGYAEHHAKAGREAAPAIVPTESLGGSRGEAAPISEIESRFIKAADIKPAEYQKMSARFQPGRVTVLE